MLPALLVSFATIVGQPVPDWPAKPRGQWVQGGPVELRELRGKVVLIRFFTSTECPFCSATAPALNELHREFSPRGLVVLGMYTPKPAPRRVRLAEVRELVREYGFEFPVALDGDWGALRTLWLDREPGAAYTSASLLVDRRGVLRHVHPGGAFARDAADPRVREDYRAMREAIVSLIEER